MNYRTMLCASLLGMLVLHTESMSMLNAAEKNATKPGPTDADAPKEFTATKSGLKYRILRKSTGAKPDKQDAVMVNYKGWLDNGKEFDSSYSSGESISFPLRGVIAGWTEGLQLVGEGGMIELEIPYDLGYGEEGSPPIPPKATLHFIVELIEVIPALKPGKTDADASKEFTTTPSGLKYRILRKSSESKPSAKSVVEVHYKGWLDDGETFDSSYERGKTIEFPLNRVVSGWTEGLQLVGTGGMIELEIPYKLGYGEAGRPPVIPPKATLHFLVELISIKKP